MAKSNRIVAAAHAGRKTNSRLPGDIFGRDLQNLRRLIGFPAHGSWRRVEAATAARDVAAGERWTFPEHRTMAQVIADEAI